MAQASHINVPVLPGGKQKGLRIDDPSVGERTLEWWSENANEPTFKHACMAELARRRGGAPPAQQQAPAPRHQAPSQAIQRQAPRADIVAGSLRESSAVNHKLRELSEACHLVAPATVCGSLPEGCEVAVSVVHVNPSTDKNGPGDVYPTGGGKLGLAKATLDKIASAAGVTWDPTLCRRLDDGRDPYYVLFTAVGYVRNFDGSVRAITGTKEMDLRDDSPQIDALNDRKKDGSGDASKQIREMRLHILGHAETKAKLRAIRSIGIKTGYTAAELQKPFAVARIMFTGRTDDPQLKREFALMNAQSMMSGTAALYGGTAPQQPAQPLMAAPPWRTRELDDDDYVPPAHLPPAPPQEVETTGQAQPVEQAPEQQGPPEDWDRGDNPNDY